MTSRKINKNVSLKNYTTFKIGGPARYFLSAQNKEEIIWGINWAKKRNLPFFILGEGSNLLVSDDGYDGLVIQNKARNFKINKTLIIAESGAVLSDIIWAGIKAGLSGMAEGAGIPGTVGGAVYGNAGWPRGAWAIGNAVRGAEILMPGGKVKKVGKKWLDFGYRESRFKKTKEKIIILEVVFKLKKGKTANLERKSREILKVRAGKIPKGFSAGSVFKNPQKNPAGFLIEKCGLKGKKIGGAMISKKHANFIVNLGGAKANDVLKLINLSKRKVKEKFGIRLKEEIQFLGF